MAARILVIEDKQANLDLMTYLLKAFNHQPLTAVDGEEGLDTALREVPDLILCDIQLPKMDGYEIAKRLKRDPRLKVVPLVAVTALAMVGDRDRILAAGFDGYIPKPIVPEKFVPQVEAFLAKEKKGILPRPSPMLTKSPVPSSEPSKATILCVDDSPTNLELLQSMLVPMGYRVLCAESVEAALDLAKTKIPDLILSDVHMPKESGFDFINSIKTDPRLSKVPFVFISASTQDENQRVEGLALGAHLFIVKPIEPQVLIEEIASLLNRKGNE